MKPPVSKIRELKPPPGRFDDEDDLRPANDASTRPPAAPFKVWTAEEIWAPLPPLEYAIGGLLPRGSVALVAAYGSSLKTWCMIDLLIAKATGGNWLEMFPCDQGDVLFFDWESGDYELRRRFHRVSAARGLIGAVQGVSMVTMPALFFNSDAFEEHVAALAATRSLVVFDSLAAGTVDVDENDARFAQGLQTLKRVAVSTGCAFVVLHHTRKGMPGQKGGDADARESPRGTGAIFAAVDVVLHLSRADEGSMLVTQTKARAGKAVEPFTVRVDDIGENATRVHAGGAPEPPEELDVRGTTKMLEAAKAKVIALLGSTHDIRSANEVCRRVGGKKTTTLEALKELRERGLIVEHEGRLRLSSEVA